MNEQPGGGGNTAAGVSDALRQAFALLEAGDAEGGEIVVLRPVVEAEQRFGAASRPFLDAVDDLGRYLILAGEPARAVDTLRRGATARKPHDGAGLRSWIACATDYGEALRAVGEEDTAEDVLRDALEERRSLFGPAATDYAAGLEPLADLLLAEGRLAEALPMAEEACLVYASQAHPRFFSALARRAEVLARAGFDGPLFPPLPELPEEMGTVLGQAVQSRLQSEDPAVMARVTRDLLPLLAEHVGEDSEATLLALALRAEAERALGEQGDAAERQSALRRMAAAYERRQEPGQTLMALQGLALAQSEAGDRDGAVATYEDALRRADALGDASERSRVLRNFGLYQAELGDYADAEARLREALKVAETGPPGAQAHAEIALGIFLTHRDRIQEAEPLLETAVSILGPNDPDARTARRYLTLLRGRANAEPGGPSA